MNREYLRKALNQQASRVNRRSGHFIAAGEIKKRGQQSDAQEDSSHWWLEGRRFQMSISSMRKGIR